MPSYNAPKTAWIITTGAAGHELPCVGVCKALGINEPKIFRVKPKGLHKVLAPWGPAKLEYDMQAPYPDLILCSARQSVAYGRKLRHDIKTKQTKIVFIQNPVAAKKSFDLICAPAHDNLRGHNVFTTLTAPHHLTRKVLEQEANKFKNDYYRSDYKNIAVLLGGPNKKMKYAQQDIMRYVSFLKNACQNEKVNFIFCPSRRTPNEIKQLFFNIFSPLGHKIWMGDTPNPYKGLLGLADNIIVTSDSINMLGEAVFTGKPVGIFQFSDTAGKYAYYSEMLIKKHNVEIFEGQIPTTKTISVNATDDIAKAILSLY